MEIDPKKNRRSLRLAGFNYGRPGGYFVTICAQGRKCLFGEIIQEEMHLNPAGEMVRAVWDDIPHFYPEVDVDAFAVMPNHIHGIIFLGVGAGPRACPENYQGQPRGVAPTFSLPDVVHRFKSFTTAIYRKENLGNQILLGRLWQRNYYEHVIRDEEELQKIREYIIYNPMKWPTDRDNPRISRPDPRDEMDIILSDSNR